ncbi:MAG TPA: nuclear transport factor 2 family protein [Pseudonocardia sp.]|jgi:ketosteroid isomerase-like protein
MTTVATDIEAAARTFYAVLDAGDPDLFDRRLADDAVFAFNDLEPVTGSTAIEQFVTGWKSNFRSLTHEIIGITVDPARGTAGVEMVVTYVFPDGHEVRLKGCSFLDFAREEVTGYRVYIDTTKLA